MVRLFSVGGGVRDQAGFGKINQHMAKTAVKNLIIICLPYGKGKPRPTLDYPLISINQ